MKQILLMLVVVFVPTFVQAEVKVKFTWAELAGITFKDGHTDRLPMASAYGVALAVPFEGFVWTVEGALVMPLSKFTPAYRVATGPVFPLDSTWSLGISLLYQYRPTYEDLPATTQQVGVGAGLVAKIAGIGVGTGLAGWKVLDGEKPALLAIQLLKLNFDLPPLAFLP